MSSSGVGDSDAAAKIHDRSPHLTSTPATSAWARISTTIRRVDAERVKDCQDDIDNILVFAGLYSAVLTALLVESYKNLLEDPKDTTVFLLRQLIMQTNSFVIRDGYINSTISHPNLIQSFTPSLAAQRVNILWFASLTISLMSASFSIIVKQWLREFLAREHSSPRQHLRIRHFRNPGLSQYKVFEIAAFIPLLLQLSLLLFFVGLCYFTASVHESIGYTTLPLVAAWGTLFIAVSLAPALDPKCPYKVPILRTPITAARKRLFGWREMLRDTLHEKLYARHEENIHGDAPSAVIETPTSVAADTCHDDARAASQSGDAEQIVSTEGASADDQERIVLEGANTAPTLDNGHPPNATPTRSDGLDGSGERGHSDTPAKRKEGVTFDEEDVAHDDRKDVDILVDALKVDAIQADDQLLRDITTEALQQASIQPEQLYTFPYGVVNYRIRPEIAKKLANSFIDMKSLSRQAYETITYMFALLVKARLEENSDTSSTGYTDDSGRDQKGPHSTSVSKRETQWLENSICALLCDSSFPHIDEVNDVLYLCLPPDETKPAKTKPWDVELPKLIRSRFQDHSDPQPALLVPVLGRLKGAFDKEKDTRRLLQIIQKIFLEFGQQSSTPPSDSARPSRCAVSYPSNCKTLLSELLVHRIKSDPIDTDIILHIDAVLVDDKVLQGEMWKTLREANCLSTSDLAHFILGAITNRANRDVSKEISTSFLDLTKLNASSYTVIMQLAAQLIVPEFREEEIAKRAGDRPHSQPIIDAQKTAPSTDPGADTAVRKGGISWDASLERAICILLSIEPPGTLGVPEIVNRALKRCLSTEFCEHTARIITSRASPDGWQETRDFSCALRKLCGGIALIEATDLLGFMRALFPDKQPSDRSNPTTTFDAIKFKVPQQHEEVVVDLFLSWATGKTQADPHRSRIFSEMFRLTGDKALVSQPERRSKVVQFVGRILMESSDSDGSSKDAEVICDIALSTTRARQTREIAQNLFVDAANLQAQVSPDVVVHIPVHLDRYYRRPDDSAQSAITKPPLESSGSTRSADIDFLPTCEFYLRLLDELPGPSADQRFQHCLNWRKLWDALLSVTSLEKFQSEGYYRPGDSNMATTIGCLDRIERVKKAFEDDNLFLPFSAKVLTRILKRKTSPAEPARSTPADESELDQFLSILQKASSTSTAPRLQSPLVVPTLSNR